MKGINYQCIYTIDDSRYPYTAFNHDGSLCGFANPPVRNFAMGIWIDSVTGEPGDVLPYERWDQSMRELSQVQDCHRPKVNRMMRERGAKK